MRAIPELETPRLRLRGHRADDHRAAIAIWKSDEVVRRLTGAALSSHEVWVRLLRYSGLWDFLGYGYWAVEDRETGEYIGQLGFADFKRDLAGVDELSPEAGWVLHPDWSGRGLATEGMGAACRWLDAAGGYPRSYCIIGPENGASIRVADKLGYRAIRDTVIGGEPTRVFRRDSA